MQQVRDRLRLCVKPIYLWWAIVVIGVILRVRQYFSGRSLWGDEAAVAFNLAQRTFVGLIQPLDYEQGAPIGFLFIEKLLILLFGNIDQVMRLFPLFSGILAVYLFYRMARAHIQSGMFAALLFAISSSLIYYSSELKQYSTDVMIGLLLVFVASRCLKEDVRSRDFWILGITGMAAIWLSHPSTFILAGIGLMLFFAAITRNRPIPVRWLLGLATMWAVSFGVEYLVSLRHLAADDYLYSYWKSAFMPFPPNGTRIWLGQTYYSLLSTALNRTDQILAVLVLVLVPIGCISLLYRDRVIAIMMISPFFIALLASAAQKYPLKGRLMLFLVPFVFFLIAEGLGCIYSLIAKWHVGIARIIYMLPALVLVLLPAAVTWGFFVTPYVGSNIKPVLQYVAEQRQEEDAIYVFHTINAVFDYYAPLFGLEDTSVLMGRSGLSKRAALQDFYNGVETLNGEDRVWFIFAGILDCGGCEGDMQLFYTDYLDERGTLLDSFHATGANAYLYDLNP
jgi:hypothetical protein